MKRRASFAGEAQFRCYAELNDFLSHARKHQSFGYQFRAAPSVKDAMEAVGVPHTEVDLILVNSESVGFDYRLQDGDRASLYPVFESLDISSLTKVREKPLRDTKFVLDVHLGKLARNLRMLGCDVRHKSNCDDSELVSLSITEDRILLTRDQGLLKNKALTHGYYVRATRPEDQIGEVMDRFDLYGQMRPFTRCTVCNGRIEKVDKERVCAQLPERTRRYYDDFFVCPDCGKIYWEGSHHRKMAALIRKLQARRRKGGSPRSKTAGECGDF